MKELATFLLLIGLSMVISSAHAQSQLSSVANGDGKAQSADYRLPTLRESADVNSRTIGIAFANNSSARKAMLALDAQLASVGEFRIVPVVEDNQLQSLYDLLFLRGVDAALINSDVIAFVASSGGYQTVLNVIDSLASVGTETLTLVGQEQIDSIESLEGRTIALDDTDTANNLSTMLIMSALEIEANYRYLPTSKIFESLLDGTVDAALIRLSIPDTGKQMQLSSGQPSQNITQLNGLNVLPVILNDSLANTYANATLTHDQLPGLIDEGNSVPALRSNVILAAYRWPRSHPRGEDMIEFVKAFMSVNQEASADPIHNLWTKLDFDSQIPGVSKLNAIDEVRKLLEAERLAPAQAELTQLALQISAKSGEILARINDESSHADDVELQRLINEFEGFLALLKP